MLVKQQVGTELSYFLSQTEGFKRKLESIDIGESETVEETLGLFNACLKEFEQSCIHQYLSEKTEIFVCFSCFTCFTCFGDEYDRLGLYSETLFLSPASI